MIEEINIQDLGVISAASLPLGAGFTAITGETGAGKTMVVAALGLLLGSRADAAGIRAGSALTSVTGRWVIPADSEVAAAVLESGGVLEEFGDKQAELLITRTVSAEGRSRGFLGGRATPAGVLADLGEKLVVLHGQSEQLRLKSETAQREALDASAGEKLIALRAKYGAAYRHWREIQAELDTLRTAHEERKTQAETLRKDLQIFTDLSPQLDEDERLREKAERLRHLEEIRQSVTIAEELISNQSGRDAPDAISLVDAARRQIARVIAHDIALATAHEGLEALTAELGEVSAELSRYLATLDENGAQELEAVLNRRAALGDFARAHGGNLNDAIAKLERGTARLAEIDQDDTHITSLSSELASAENLVRELAKQLSNARRAAAKTLGQKVSAELAALALPDARIVAQISETKLGEHGADRVEFLFIPHAGVSERSLAKAASGGELSRIMLALEVVLARGGKIPTFVFDEVDAGVGGAAAIEIGRRLARLAKTAQVIVVTHLAQVAAFAGNHLVVTKDSAGAVTASSVRQVTGEERVAEMARLLSGLPDSETGLQHARELLTLAQ